MNKKFDVGDRQVEFAVKTALFYKNLSNTVIGGHYSNQLLSSIGSLALNFKDA